MRTTVLLLILALCFALAPAAQAEEIGTGTLKVVNKEVKDLEVPLAHTSVDADVAGFVARVTVTQTFVNPFKNPIEAVYVFPLPHRAAVDSMTMKIGDRVIKGVIKPREEARKIYEQAKKAGKTTSLLEQERPNIFTQSIANIMPGDNIEIQITYFDVLKYESGQYEFVFPMVVGPRYIPGEKIVGKQGGGWAPDTDRVPDASRITPPVIKPGERSGHDIDLTLRIDGGVKLDDPKSPSHWIKMERGSSRTATVKLDERDTIPNKDFILRYKVIGKAPSFGSVVFSEGDSGYFLLMLAPKADYSKKEIIPREILFVVDSSGSQQGDPLTKSKELVRRALKGLRVDDTFQVFDFNDIVTSMASGPVPATAANIREARKFVDQIRATGGTRMLPVIQTALNWPEDPKRLRIVVMTTDGYIGNETEILTEINDNLGDARLFMFGVGGSTNLYLIARMAEEGRGFAQFVRQDEATQEVVEKFHQRLDTPVLRDIEVDWNGLEVTDLYPERMPDLYAGQPLAIFGRFTKPGGATVTIGGKQGNGTAEFEQRLRLPGKKSGSEQLASLWARMRVEKLMQRLEVGRDELKPLEDEITQLGLKYNLMTQFTSFVAVEEKVRNVDGKLQTVQVPVEMPEGVSYEGVFGEAEEKSALQSRNKRMYRPSVVRTMAPPPPPSKPSPHRGGALGIITTDEVAEPNAAYALRLDPVAFLGISDESPYRRKLQTDVARSLGQAVKGMSLPDGKMMMIRLTLSASGKVAKVEVLKDTTGDAKLKAKIVAALKKPSFKAPGNEATLVFFVRF